MCGRSTRGGQAVAVSAGPLSRHFGSTETATLFAPTCPPGAPRTATAITHDTTRHETARTTAAGPCPFLTPPSALLRPRTSIPTVPPCTPTPQAVREQHVTSLLVVVKTGALTTCGRTQGETTNRHICDSFKCFNVHPVQRLMLHAHTITCNLRLTPKPHMISQPSDAI